MSEMILNHASACPSSWKRDQAIKALVNIAEGMASLVNQQIVEKTLRAEQNLYEIIITEQQSLFELLTEMLKAGTRDAAMFWLRLAQKVPLLAELPDKDLERFYGTEADATLGVAKQVLMLSFHQGAATISFPTEAQWDQDIINFSYLDLQEGSEIITATAEVDNLARASHAFAIASRRDTKIFSNITFRDFWVHRRQLFPDLQFGLDVENHLAALGNNLFPTIMHCLRELQLSAKAWKINGGTMPVWRTLITSESVSLQENERLANLRQFSDANGTTQTYFWHARFGYNRIHFRMDTAKRLIEIGYIGAHLPLR